MKRSILSLCLCLFSAVGHAQSLPNGGVYQGEVWTPAQWNLAWSSKMDYANGLACDGVTDIGPQLQALVNAVPTSVSGIITLPSGTCVLNSPVVINNIAVTIQGQGYTEGPSPALGTWLKITNTSFTPFLIEGVNARGTVFKDFAVWQQQPNLGAGWTPNPYPYVFDIENTLGEVTFDHILLAGITKGIKDYNSGRLNIRTLIGQVYTIGIFIDLCEDIPRIDYVHFWTYVTSASQVVAYQEANLDTILLGRVDGIYLGDIFALAERSVIHLENAGNGITSKAYVSNLYADFAQYGIWIDSTSANSSIQVANATTQHNDFNNGATPLNNSAGLEIDSTGNLVQIANWRSNLLQNCAFCITAASNVIHVGSFVINGFNIFNNGSAAIDSVSGNSIQVAFPFLSNGNTNYLSNINGVVSSVPQLFEPADSINTPVMFASSTGNGVGAEAIGGDTNLDFLVESAGPTSSVRLLSDGQVVLRTDDNSGTGNSDILVRSQSGIVALIEESASTNASITVSPKGSGVFQSNAPFVLPVYSAAGTPAPTCNSGVANSIAVASDATTPTYNGTYTSGGAVRTLIFCTGSAWTTH